jgi:hypothetical protein
MWILSLLPEWVIHAIFMVGVLGVILGFVLGFLPFLGRYKLAIQIISVLILAFGVYLEGGFANEQLWQMKVKEMEVKVKEAEVKAAQKNVEIQEKVVTKTQIVKEKGQDIIKYVDRYRDREVVKTIEGPERVKIEEVIKFVENCPIPQDIIDAHNSAAKMNEAAKGDKK